MGAGLRLLISLPTVMTTILHKVHVDCRTVRSGAGYTTYDDDTQGGGKLTIEESDAPLLSSLLPKNNKLHLLHTWEAPAGCGCQLGWQYLPF